MTAPITPAQLADLALVAGFRARSPKLDRQLIANSIAAAANTPALAGLTNGPSAVAITALCVYDLAQLTGIPAGAVDELAALAAVAMRSHEWYRVSVQAHP